MAIGNSPGSQTRGTPFNLTINKANLASNASVSGDSYFNTSSNWKQIWVVYKSSTSNQMEVIKFDASESTPTRSVLFSTASRGNFEVKSIIIVDKQNGKKIVPRSALSAGEFDVTLDAGAFAWNVLSANMITNGNGELHTTATGDSWTHSATDTTALTGDFTFNCIYYPGGVTAIAEFMVGVSTSLQSANFDMTGISNSCAYLHQGIINHFGNGSQVSSNLAFTNSQNISIEVKRVGTLITIKIGSTVLVNYTYAGTVYIVAAFYSGTNATTHSITSASLSQP